MNLLYYICNRNVNIKYMKQTKVSMNLSHKTMANIEELSSIMNETNRTRVIASSLEIAKYICRLVDEGGTITKKDKDGNISELKLIY